MYQIHPVPKRYAWGSQQLLQQMFRLEGNESSGPLAEMWFSGHPQSPSTIDIPETGAVSVTDAIVQHPEQMIGKRGSDQFGPVLPYLLKIIAANEPLSLQVHPVGFQARAGFNEENAAGVPLDSPVRSFKDTNAKSEMVVALGQFQASVGFASRAFALKNLSLVDHPVAQRMVAALNSSKDDAGEFADADAMMPVSAVVWPLARKRIFRAFHAAITADMNRPSAAGQSSTTTTTANESWPPLGEALQQAAEQATFPRQKLAFEFALTAEGSFPEDYATLALLMMNPLVLEEGESVFIPTGVPHAYIHGIGAEIMTNSDNVLRAGMTVKHKDIAHLLHCLDCRSASPVNPADSHTGTLLMRDMVFYKPGVNEYMLAYGHVDSNHEPWPLMNELAKRYDKLVQQVSGKVTLPHLGPRIVVCTEGAVNCITQHEERVLTQGDAVFVPASDGWARVDPVMDGSAAPYGSFVIASTPF